MNTWQTWLTLIGMGAVTFAIRMSFILLPPDIRVPLLLKRALAYVAAAVLPALIAPDVLLRGTVTMTVGSWGFDAMRLFAALLAAAVAWKTRSVFATLATGLGALLVMRHWMLA
ncbi:MAG: AzlD domain-containing protein [Betaproteobacteria bacterium]|nr:AzlD domain-containing protein [Betaproteobacteria bacterium]